MGMDEVSPTDAAERSISHAALWQAFQGKATTLGARVEQFADADAATALLADETEGLMATPALAERFPQLAKQCAGVVWARHGREQAPVREVITFGRCAVAETGSALVCEDNAGRAACFLAERLWLLVPGANHRAAMRLGQCLEKRVVPGERGSHPCGVLLPQTNAPLDVGEEERHRPGGQGRRRMSCRR
jgi:hypothetical protein